MEKKTIYLKEEQIDETKIEEIANAIKEGKLIIFPTDTVYGIGTNAYNEEACKKIYEIKGRPSCKPLSILISDISMIEDLVENISPTEQKIIEKFWPGPLTMKFKKRKGILPDIISAGDEYVRIRLIKNGLIYKIIEKAEVPVVAPSANISGHPTGIKIDNIIKELGGKVDYILDCGDYKSDEPSTIVQVEDEKIVVIREGKIKREELENL
jgi:sua5/yciO/yrdC/ywlC family protein